MSPETAAMLLFPPCSAVCGFLKELYSFGKETNTFFQTKHFLQLGGINGRCICGWYVCFFFQFWFWEEFLNVLVLAAHNERENRGIILMSVLEVQIFSSIHFFRAKGQEGLKSSSWAMIVTRLEEEPLAWCTFTKDLIAPSSSRLGNSIQGIIQLNPTRLPKQEREIRNHPNEPHRQALSFTSAGKLSINTD